MISSRELQQKLSGRAIRLFFKDIREIKELVAEHGGTVSILDAMAISAKVDKQEAKAYKKSWLSFLTKSNHQVIAQEDTYPYTFLLNFMARLGFEEISVDDFKDLNLRQIYMENYKKEYEEFQLYQFNLYEKPYYDGEIKIIRPEKFSQTTDSEMENC